VRGWRRRTVSTRLALEPRLDRVHDALVDGADDDAGGLLGGAEHLGDLLVALQLGVELLDLLEEREAVAVELGDVRLDG
jgi:hypothetical protein